MAFIVENEKQIVQRAHEHVEISKTNKNSSNCFIVLHLKTCEMVERTVAKEKSPIRKIKFQRIASSEFGLHQKTCLMDERFV